MTMKFVVVLLALLAITACESSRATPWVLLAYVNFGPKEPLLMATFPKLEDCMQIRQLYERPCNWLGYQQTQVLDCRGPITQTKYTCEKR